MFSSGWGVTENRLAFTRLGDEWRAETLGLRWPNSSTHGADLTGPPSGSTLNQFDDTRRNALPRHAGKDLSWVLYRALVDQMDLEKMEPQRSCVFEFSPRRSGVQRMTVEKYPSIDMGNDLTFYCRTSNY
jgi:hypothetical protein